MASTWRNWRARRGNREAVQSLTWYKGIKNLFALTTMTEIDDIQQFPHPRQLMSWNGMDVREYSSGGKHNRLLLAGKHPNKVKVACAREMVAFIWDSLRAVAA